MILIMIAVYRKLRGREGEREKIEGKPGGRKGNVKKHSSFRKYKKKEK